MAYSVNPGELLPRALKRVVREEAAEAVAHLTGSEDRHEAIHEARKSVKKIRALLLLLEPRLGATAVNADRRLRDLGRVMSVLRDAAAMVQTFEQLAEKYPGEMGLNRFAGVRECLVAASKQAMNGAEEKTVASAAVAEFRKLARQANLWRISGEGFAVIADSFNATYEAGRKALRRAAKHPSTENIHELRKRIKDHWYHVRLLGPLWPGASEPYAEALQDLQETLGNSNNVSVLLRSLGRNVPDLLRDIATRWREKLRSDGLAAASKIYAAKSPPVAHPERPSGYML